MGWIIGTIFLLAIIIACHAFGGFLRNNAPSGEENSYKASARAIAWGGTIVTFGFWMLMTIVNMVHSVDKGHIGLVTTFGAITTQRSNGLAIIAPWQKLEEVDVRSQTTCAKGDRPESGECKSSFEPFSRENIDVHLKGAFTYHVDAGDIQFLYTKIGPNFENKVILPLLSETVRAVVPQYSYTAIAENRIKISNEIRDRMSANLANHPQPGVSAIKADAFALMNFDFNDDVKVAINKKVLENENANAAQAALLTAQRQAEANKAKAEGDANVARAVAQGAADAVVIKAKGEADSNRLLSDSITPQLLQLRTLETQKIQWGLVQPGTNIIGALSDFFKSAPAVPAPAR